MVIRLTGTFLLLIALAGCKGFDGTFEPGCAAYTGDRVVLRNGGFEWDRYTDAIQVDEDGNAMDAFPDYPKRGTYEVVENRVVLEFADDDETKVLHIYQHDSMGLQLLTDAQLATVRDGGLDEDCALTRVGQDQ